MKYLKRIINKYINWTPNKSSRVIMLFAPFFLFFIKKFELDNDFWFLINTGREIIKSGFITIEPFTIHSNLVFIPQQWLTTVIFYYIYNKFGIYGIYFILLLVNVVVIFLIYKLSLLISKKKYNLSIFLTLFVDAMIVIGFLKSRPQIFDMIFVLTEIYILELYIKNKKTTYLYCLPLISLAMINLHASIWPMLLVITIPYFIGKIKTSNSQNENYNLKPIIITTIAMIVIAFINPYGIKAMLYLFKSYDLKGLSNYIGEMKPIPIRGNLTIYLYIFLIFVSYYVASRKNKKICIRYLFLFLGTTYLGLSHCRGLLFLLIGGIPAIADNFKNNNIEKEKTTTNKYTNVFYTIMILMASIYAIFSSSVVKEREMSLYQIANYLDENSTKKIKLYTDYDNGSYFEYRGYKCYIDPRAEIFYKSNNKKEDIMIEYLKLKVMDLDPKVFLSKYNFDYLVVDDYDILYYYLENLNYKIVYQIKDKRKNITYRLYRNGEKNEENTSSNN